MADIEVCKVNGYAVFLEPATGTFSANVNGYTIINRDLKALEAHIKRMARKDAFNGQRVAYQVYPDDNLRDISFHNIKETSASGSLLTTTGHILNPSSAWLVTPEEEQALIALVQKSEEALRAQWDAEDALETFLNNLKRVLS